MRSVFSSEVEELLRRRRGLIPELVPWLFTGVPVRCCVVDSVMGCSPEVLWGSIWPEVVPWAEVVCVAEGNGAVEADGWSAANGA